MITYEIKSPRLQLRLLEKNDISYLASLEADPEVKQYFPSGVRNRDETEKMIRRFLSLAEKGLPGFLIFESDSGEFVGRIGFGISDGGEVEVGYALHKKFWGRGYATESLSAALAWARENLPADEIIAYAECDNLASIRVMEKCGMGYLGKGFARGAMCYFYRIANQQK